MAISSLVVQVLMLVLLVLGSLSLMQGALLSQARHHLDGQEPQLSAALAVPIAQYDYSSAQQILDEILAKGGYRYLALRDTQGHPIAAAGLDGRALPALDASLERGLADGVYDARLIVTLGGQPYGELRYGYATDFFSLARERMVNLSGGLAVAAIFSSWVMLAFIAAWLTRRLTKLTEASRALAAGDFEVSLPVGAGDEVGQLAEAFGDMATQLRNRMAELRESEQRLYAISHYTYDLELWIDRDGRTLWVNPSVRRMTGYTPDECLAMSGFPICLVHDEDREEARWRLQEALGEHAEVGIDFQFRMSRRDGSHFWASANWQPIIDAEGRSLGVRASVRDIGDLKRIEENMLDSLRRLKISEAGTQEYLRQAEQERSRLMALLSAMNMGILFVGTDGRVVCHNPAFLQLWRLPEGNSPVGRPAVEVFEAAERGPARPEEFAAHIRRLLAGDAEGEPLEIPMQGGRVITQRHYPVHDKAGELSGYLWIYEDVTRERQDAEQLLYLAERDSLTGLYNRHRFRDELERAIAEASRHRATCALLFFDLDEFKAINDHFGHAAGDALLIRVAGEVSGKVRKHEALFRLGGDEFAVIVPFAELREAELIADRIVRAIAQIPFQFEGQHLHISSSLGIALYPEHAADGEQLVAYADSAMYQAKHAGKNAWRIYRPELDQTPEMMHRLSWNERLNQALERDLFELHFQGVYRIDDRRISHLEALIRLRDEQTGELVPPGEFIPVAESGPKIVAIDRWVIREAVRLLARYPAMPSVAVNLSGRSFDDIEMPAYIADTLREHGVEPGRLLVEITETAAVTDLTDAQRFMETIQRTGCQVCLDDFGAGFSSFAYLKHIAVDIVKIDGMFIRNLVDDHDNQVLVRGMLAVAKGLGKRVVAECVEDAATLHLLAELGVDMAQGWHLDKPQATHPAIK